jgi:hypothetical protein
LLVFLDAFKANGAAPRVVSRFETRGAAVILTVSNAARSLTHCEDFA